MNLPGCTLVPADTLADGNQVLLTTGDTPGLLHVNQPRSALLFVRPDLADQPLVLGGEPLTFYGPTVNRLDNPDLLFRAALDATLNSSPVLYDVLANAYAHTPASNPGKEPWGCVICGCADGVGACDTWESGLVLAAAHLTGNVTETHPAQ